MPARVMVLTPVLKTAMLFKISDMPKHQQPANFFDQLRTSLRAADNDPLSKREPLGRKQIAGREMVGYRSDAAQYGNGDLG